MVNNTFVRPTDPVRLLLLRADNFGDEFSANARTNGTRIQSRHYDRWHLHCTRHFDGRFYCANLLFVQKTAMGSEWLWSAVLVIGHFDGHSPRLSVSR